MAPAISGRGFQDQVERSLLGEAPMGGAGLGEDIGEPGLVQEQSKKWCRMDGGLRKTWPKRASTRERRKSG